MKTVKKIIVIGLILVVAALIGLAMMAFSRADVSEAEDWAKEYLAEMYPKNAITKIKCLPVDSDGDGYVSCPSKLEGLDQPVSIECVGTWPWHWKWLSEGCRPIKANIQ